MLKAGNKASTPPSEVDPDSEIWALKDFSLDIRSGEALGIVGRNGAGKSTFLKILSQITAPTCGEVRIRGRVASLLEVGTGFHPELTGRENIHLNGSILGMKRAEIRRKFDEIVGFSGVEQFIDTPVKRYSSGMHVRLAFAVAAHLDPEILLIDEVLAVGDLEFQKRCLGKMDEVAKTGRTVVFVSHQLGLVKTLCTRACLLDGGRLIDDGAPESVIARYVSIGRVDTSGLYRRSEGEGAKLPLSFREIRLCGEDGASAGEFRFDESIRIRVECHSSLDSFEGVILAVAVRDSHERKVFTGLTRLEEQDIRGDRFTATMSIPSCFLAPGSFYLQPAICMPGRKIFDTETRVCDFRVLETGSEFSGFGGEDVGCVFSPCDWKFESV